MHLMNLAGNSPVTIGISARSRKSAILRAAIAATALTFPAALHADGVTSTWNGATGKWTDPSCWLNNPAAPGYPGSGSAAYYVVLTGPTSGYVLALDSNVTIQSLTLDADSTLNHTAGRLTLNTDSTIAHGSYLLAGGSLAGAGNLLVSGNLTWTSGDMDIGGKTIIAPAATLQLSGTNLRWLKRTLDNRGSITHADANLYLQATLNNLAGATFTMTSGQYNDYNGTFNNAGTFTKTSSDVATLSAAFNNTGAVNIQSGMLQIDKGTDSGTYNIAGGATLCFTGNRTYNPTVVIDGPGSLNFTSATHDFAGQIKSTGPLAISSGTLNFNAAQQLAGPVQLSGGALAGTANITIKQSLTWTHGDMSGTGKTIIAPEAALQISGTNWRWLKRTLDNSGSITHSDANLYLQGALNNLAGASFTINAGQYNDYNGTFNNAGTFTKISSDLTTLSAAFNNTGTTKIEGGTLRLLKGADSGTYSIAQGATLELSNNRSYTGVSFTGQGTVAFIAGTQTCAGPVEASAPVNFTGGTLDGGGDLTIKQSLVWTHGEMSGTGKTIIAPGATLQISGNNSRWLRRTLDNSGSTTYADSSLYLQGTLNNLAGGTFTMTSGQFNDYNGSFNNAGAFTKTSGNLARFLVAFNNTGTVAVNAGTLQIAKGADTGSYNIASGAKLNLEGNRAYESTAAITGPGSVTFLNGTHTFAGQLQSPGDLTIAGQARLNITGSPDKPQLIRQLSFSGDGTLDLGQSDLVVQATAATRNAVLKQITGYIKSARNHPVGRWQGPGLTSSAAQATPLTGLAVLLNDTGDGTPILSTLAGQPLTINDILVKYTWNGDVNLDGAVNIADYFLVDSGFITQQGGYRHGDLNYDGKVDIDDYFLIDSAFIAQAAPLASTHPIPEPASPLPLIFPATLLLHRRPRTQAR